MSSHAACPTCRCGNHRLPTTLTGAERAAASIDCPPEHAEAREAQGFMGRPVDHPVTGEPVCPTCALAAERILTAPPRPAVQP